VYSRIYSRVDAKYYCNTGMDKKSALKLSKEFGVELKSNFKIDKIYLFGSYIKGKPHEESDIDIAIVFNDFESKMEIQMELLKLRRKYDTRIEPHPFRKKDFNYDDPLASQILKFGKEI
jgi:uncharacterized protein